MITYLLYKGLVVESVACGFAHTLAVTKNGKLFSWGLGRYGALGLGDFNSKSVPTEITFFNSFYQSHEELEII